MPPLVSILIITRDSGEHIRRCLASLRRQRSGEVEVIVVDNGSTDAAVSIVRDAYPEAIVVRNAHNLGACRARNQGIDRSLGKWVLTLDCDTELADDFLERAIPYVRDVPGTIGMVQPEILKDDRHTVYSRGIYLSRFLRRFYDVAKGEAEVPFVQSASDLFGACCAAAFFRRQMLEELKEETGYFDERFFFLVEDVDLAWRAHIKGYQAAYFPHAVCYHAGNSSQIPPAVRRRLCIRNRFLMIEKNESFAGKVRLVLCGWWYDIPRWLYLRITARGDDIFSSSAGGKG